MSRKNRLCVLSSEKGSGMSYHSGRYAKDKMLWNSKNNKLLLLFAITGLFVISAAAGFFIGMDAEGKSSHSRSPVQLENVDLSVTDKNFVEQDVIYPGNGPYLFVATIVVYDNLNSLSNVTLEIDPSGYGISVKWEQNGEAFSIIDNPMNSIDLIQSESSSENNAVDTWIIAFAIEFNWEFPEQASANCRLTSGIFSGQKYSDMFQNVFIFENDLSFLGKLTVTNTQNNEVKENQWVPAYETLNWSGITVIFSDSELEAEPVYPKLPELKYKLIDEAHGSFWIGEENSGIPLSMETFTGSESFKDVIYNLTLINLPDNVELENEVTFTLNIDSEPIIFSDYFPKDDDDFFNSYTVNCGISVKDLGGSGVDTGSLEYAVSIHGIQNYGSWNKVPEDNIIASTDGATYDVTVETAFANGTDNYIKWRASDNAGNGEKDGYYESTDIPVKINVASIINYSPIILLEYPKNSTEVIENELITFSGMDSYDPDGDSLTFNWSSNISGFLSDEPFFQSTLEPGTHLITLIVYDGQSEPVTRTAVVIVNPIETGKVSNGEPESGMILEPSSTTAGTATIILIVLLYFFGGTEVGKYKLLGIVIPLYSKLTKKMVLDHETRGMIRGYIIANPGDHFTSIKRHIGLKNGTLAYHLKILERENIIKSQRDGIFKRFYPMNIKVTPDMVHLSKQEVILNTIIENPGITRKDLAIKIGLSRQVINYHAKGLIQAGFVRSEKYGKRIQYYASEPSLADLEHLD